MAGKYDWLIPAWSHDIVDAYIEVKVKFQALVSSYWKFISELQGVACHMGCYICHPTQANTPPP